MMKQKIVWRLKEAPTPENLRELVKDGILSKEEAREILFSSEIEGGRDKESLQSEIRFLRELVEKLANGSNIITAIREIEIPVYQKSSWYQPYYTWTSSVSPYLTSSGTAYLSGVSDSISISNTTCPFSDIKTF